MEELYSKHSDHGDGRPRLPGADIIAEGLRQLASGQPGSEIAALLVSIGAPRLRSLGHGVPNPIADPEHRLYDLLASQHGDAAHSRYRALIRLLVSYERAKSCESGREHTILGNS